MSDPRFLQTGFDKQLSTLIEECGEVLAAAGKTQRWGRNSVNPPIPVTQQETNEPWLIRELADLKGAIARLEETMVAEKMWGLYWVGEESEVYAARSVEEAVEFVRECTGQAEAEFGEVTWDADGQDEDGNPINIWTDLEGLVEGGLSEPAQLWTAYN